MPNYGKKEVVKLANLEEKQIAKDIVIEMLKEKYYIRSEYPNAKTITQMICASYKEILKTISEDE